LPATRVPPLPLCFRQVGPLPPCSGTLHILSAPLPSPRKEPVSLPYSFTQFQCGRPRFVFFLLKSSTNTSFFLIDGPPVAFFYIHPRFLFPLVSLRGSARPSFLFLGGTNGFLFPTRRLLPSLSQPPLRRAFLFASDQYNWLAFFPLFSKGNTIFCPPLKRRVLPNPILCFLVIGPLAVLPHRTPARRWIHVRFPFMLLSECRRSNFALPPNATAPPFFFFCHRLMARYHLLVVVTLRRVILIAGVPPTRRSVAYPAHFLATHGFCFFRR